MNIERRVTDWLHAEAPPRAPDHLLRRTLETVDVVRQERVLWRSGPLAKRRGGSRPLLLLAATLVALSLLGGSVALFGTVPLPAPITTPRLGLAYGLDGDIYVSDWDGTNPVRIADGDRDVQCDSFIANRGLTSPDGRYIAYRSEWSDDCDGMVYVTDAAGSLLASFPGVGWNIAWSPDSTRLATWLDFGRTIGVYGIDLERQAIVDGALMCCGDLDPVWSPDGSEAVLVRRSHDEAYAVYEVPIDGATPRPLPADDPRSYLGVQKWGGRQVAYSPDGTRVAVVAGDSLMTMADDGTERRILVEAAPKVQLSDVMWSPSGNRIAYLEIHDTVPLETRTLQLIDPRTGIVTTLASAQEGSVIASAIGFSPNGDWLLFGQTHHERGMASLWVVDTDGGAPRMVVDGTGDAGWRTLPAGIDGSATP
ncbi:MAG: hypothetical protein M3N29_04190 [Chloroflexota bacterium]|nr:hypothetical protein [Chloroflexota bacterium]